MNEKRDHPRLQRRGIVLAGGSGSRLYPVTRAINKHLIPVYDKPMIYYALSVLMLADIREVQIITNPEHKDSMFRLLGDGRRLGMQIEYAVQEKPGGLPEAYMLANSFLNDHPSALILGDNLFYGSNLQNLLRQNSAGAENRIYLSYVQNPFSYGVAVVDEDGRITDIAEKPATLISNFAITGLYLFDNSAPTIARGLKRSDRGELEITDIIRHYHQSGCLEPVFLNRGTTWMDMGTPDRVASATALVQSLDNSRNLKIAVPEEIAWRNGWINTDSLLEYAAELKGTPYGDYLRNLPDFVDVPI